MCTHKTSLATTENELSHLGSDMGQEIVVLFSGLYIYRKYLDSSLPSYVYFLCKSFLSLDPENKANEIKKLIMF